MTNARRRAVRGTAALVAAITVTLVATSTPVVAVQPRSTSVLVWGADALSTAYLGVPWEVSLETSHPGVNDPALRVEAWFRPTGGGWSDSGQSSELSLVTLADGTTTYRGTSALMVTRPGDWTWCYQTATGRVCGVNAITGAPPGRDFMMSPRSVEQGVLGFGNGNGNLPPIDDVHPQAASFTYTLPVTILPAAGQKVRLERGLLLRSGVMNWSTVREYTVPADGKIDVTLTRPPKSVIPKVLTNSVSTRVPITAKFRLALPAADGYPARTSQEAWTSWWVKKSEVPAKWQFPPPGRG